jgi:hypothetical protein
MAFKDLEQDVAELFAEAQGNVPAVVPRDGMHTVNPQRKRTNTPARRVYMRKYMADREKEQIGQRLLAGERPKIGRPGSQPKRWIELAEELGIDLTASA